MNIHHLELFYHVATHGGISAAIRRMPYGIQQPAVSGQILQLEKTLGLRLFHRRPFALTPAGHELFAFAEPFFGRVLEMSNRLRGEEDTLLRLAAPATILRNHLPALLRQHKRKYPALRLQLHDANQASAEALLRKGKIDLAVTELEGKPAAGIHSAVLFKLSLILIVPRRMKVKSAMDLWRNGKPTETLISLPPEEVMVKQFHARLARLGVNWPTRVEVSAMDLIPIYVSLGFGAGLSLAIPGTKLEKGLRSLPLPQFPPLVVAVLWQKNLRPSSKVFLEEIRKRAAAVAGRVSS
ncbi:MAG: LysR family transcriptional regulator [Verrucomicrobia bacterium]|nr:MAG: LysR family transcriptional regulator [Verrucomicrobiota bacterium]